MHIFCDHQNCWFKENPDSEYKKSFTIVSNAQDDVGMPIGLTRAPFCFMLCDVCIDFKCKNTFKYECHGCGAKMIDKGILIDSAASSDAQYCRLCFDDKTVSSVSRYMSWTVYRDATHDDPEFNKATLTDRLSHGKNKRKRDAKKDETSVRDYNARQISRIFPEIEEFVARKIAKRFDAKIPDDTTQSDFLLENVW